MCAQIANDKQGLPKLENENTDLIEPVDPERIAFESQFEGPGTITQWRELILAVVFTAVWFLLFTGGTLISTAPYRQAISGGFDTFGILTNSTMIILFWTITNIGFLSITSAILGAFGQRTHFTSGVLNQPSISLKTNQNVREVYIHYASAAVRGFGIYILFLSGLLVLATEVLITPDQSQYVRMAGMVSVVSLYVGYEPGVFAGLLDRLKLTKT